MQTSLFKRRKRDFPGGPVVKNLPSNAEDAGSIPGRGTKISHAAWHSQKELCFYLHWGKDAGLISGSERSSGKGNGNSL